MARKRATSLEVAKEAGVSRTTVSLVLNNIPGSGIPEVTRKRVRQAADLLYYHPNVSGRRLVSGRTYTLALVMHQSSESAASDMFLLQVLQGLDVYLSRHRYHILFCPVDPENARDGYAQLVYEGHVDGIVLSGPQLEEPEAVELYKRNLPIVLTGRLPGYDVPYVDADNYQGAQLATGHLIELGHQRIGLITNAPLTYIASRERYRGYQDALLAADLIYDPALVREGSFTGDSGFKAMNLLLDRPDPPSAVFVASDVVAFGAMQAAKERGLRIPEDIALVGFDDVSFAQYMEPALTTVRLPAYELGWNAGQLAMALIGQKEPGPLNQLLPTELIVRRSSGPRV